MINLRMKLPLLCLFLFLVGSKSQKCWIDGSCDDGITIGASEVSSKEECLEICQTDEDCFWFTHFSTDSICVKFSECKSISTDSCDDCISGERFCLPQYKCWFGGLCQGSFLSAVVTSSPDDCFKACRAEEDCKWFSFDKDEDDGNVCLLLEDCNTIQEDCTDCISGQRECKPRGKKLVVGTGNYFDRDDKFEVIHITDDSTNITSECQNLPRYPETTRGTVGWSRGPEMIPTVCGGFLNEDYGRDCYELKDLNKGWEKIASMNEKRGFTGFALFNGSLWVTGGYDRLPTSEIFVEDSWTPGPGLPDGRGFDRHCLVAINVTTALLIGGNTNDTSFSSKTWFFNLEQSNWIQGPELSIGRFGHACGVLRDADGSGTKVVVVSGYVSDPSIITQVTEILDVETNSWSFGPPILAYGAGMTEDGDGGLYLIGGRLDSADRVNTVYLFRDGFLDWKLLPQKLKQKREYPATFLIPDHLTNCS